MTTANPHAGPDHDTLWVHHQRAEIDAAEERVLRALARHGYPDSSRFAIRLALEEALANAFQHGHRGMPQETPARVDFTVGPDSAVIRVEDQGPGFDPASVPDPTLETNLEMPRGRGLLLMRAYMSSVEFNPRGNVVTMTYHKPERQ